MSTIMERVKEVIGKRSNDEVANDIGVSTSNVYKTLKYCAVPSKEFVKKLCAAYHVNAMWIWEELGAKDAQKKPTSVTLRQPTFKEHLDTLIRSENPAKEITESLRMALKYIDQHVTALETVVQGGNK